jgi:hypothetical protein
MHWKGAERAMNMILEGCFLEDQTKNHNIHMVLRAPTLTQQGQDPASRGYFT